MKIAIVGPGAMGTLFAGLLLNSHRKENKIWLLDKDGHRARKIQKAGIRISGLSKTRIKPGRLFITADPRKPGTADLIIFFVKSFDTQSAARRISPCIGKNTLILTLQNGLGNAEVIQKNLPKKAKKTAILAGTTSEAASLVSQGVVEHTGRGETVFGQYAGPKIKPSLLKQIKNVFNSASIKSSTVKNVKGLIWSKLVLNSAINPLGAITLKKNGDLLKDRCLKELLFLTAGESACVARAAGIRLFYKDPAAKIRRLCRKAAKNYNSMLQDILRGGKTEIDHINGAIILAARNSRHSLATPLNKMLYCFVKLMEKSAQAD